MADIWARRKLQGKQKCANCGRPFTPRKEGQRYGPRCETKMAKTHLEIKNTKGETLAAIV